MTHAIGVGTSRSEPEIDGTRDDEPLLRTRHRHVVEAQALGSLRFLPCLLDRLVVEGAAVLRGHGIGDAEAEAAVGQRKNLVGRRRNAIAPGVGDDHNIELEALRGMDGEQANSVGAFLLGHRLELAGADRLLLADEPDETLDVRPPELLVRARETRELPQVRIAPAPVPLGEHGEVVVVLSDDLLAEPLQREPRHRLYQAFVALAESAHQPLVPLGESGGHGVLEPREERPPRRDPAKERERVVRDTDERRREHRQERHIVVPVVQQAQIREQIGDLLLAEVALTGCPVGRQPGARGARPRTTRRRCRRRRGGRSPRSCSAAVDELAHAPRDGASLAAPPVDAGVLVALLVGDEQLDGMAEHRIGELGRRRELLELATEVRAEELVDHGEHLRARPVVERERKRLRGRFAALAEDLHICVAEPVDRLELVADEEELRRPVYGAGR